MGIYQSSLEKLTPEQLSFDKFIVQHNNEYSSNIAVESTMDDSYHDLSNI